jgi:hypothetical protein
VLSRSAGADQTQTAARRDARRTSGRLRDSAMAGICDWTGTRPSCNLRADRRCLLCVQRGRVQQQQLSVTLQSVERQSRRPRDREEGRPTR